MNTIPKTISEIENNYNQFGVDSISCQISQQDLRLQLREYCEAHGIGEVNNIIEKEVHS